MLLEFEKELAGKKIFITGHSGFTGCWTCLWLGLLDADLAGYSLPPETSPSLFEAAHLADSLQNTFADIGDYETLHKAMRDFQPDLVLHLAAQPLVRRSYREPLKTFAVNALGTAHVLEAARNVRSVKGILCVTTDKVYRNNEWEWPYRENDALGGDDPYSASKAAAEMIIQSYMFRSRHEAGPAIAIARGGNIIGGGDWSEDRLIPDFVRAVVNSGTLELRYPEATRPWQHVLALVQGYLILLAGLRGDSPERYTRAWNLGPRETERLSVRDVLECMSRFWKRPALASMANPLSETRTLALDSSSARALLGWAPAWDAKKSIQETAAWYHAYYTEPERAKGMTLDQINAWRRAIRVDACAANGPEQTDFI